MAALVVLCFALPAFAADAPTAATTKPPGSKSAVPWAHKPLRQNAPPSTAEQTVPAPFAGYPGVPPFEVVPQKDKPGYFPCMQCHQALAPNAEPRFLEVPHTALLAHGQGRLWCLDCHKADDRNVLRTMRGDKVDFNDAYLVCGECHFNRQKDWYFGAHGKRVANWQGKRTLFNCTHCHDPHDPATKPRAPGKKPPLRAGLEPMRPAVRENGSAWQRTAQAEAPYGH